MGPHRSFEDDCRANGHRLSHPPPGDEVVISGISGCYPQAENIHELRDKLLNKIDLIVERKHAKNTGLPAREGVLKTHNKFDAAFFEIPAQTANSMDPGSRMLLEKTYEAIADAGVNHLDLRGKKVGVYVTCCVSETENVINYAYHQTNSHTVDGTARVVSCNKISRWLHVTGPSLIVDTACSSSAFALDTAYQDIRDGICDSAVVGGLNITSMPNYTMGFVNLGVCSKEGICRVFDDEASGYVRSEAVCAVYLQKAKHAKRVYATILHSKTNCDGFKPQGVTFPSSAAQYQLLETFYKECGVNPASVNYVEAHGTGTQAGDVQEVLGFQKVFCPGRMDPLPIGSVKSNLGHSEGPSGLCSLSKIILCMETGKLLPNLHYKTPNKNLDALINGELQVVTEVMSWSGGLAAMNSFGFGGANAHVLLRQNLKEKKNGGLATDGIPRLVVVSGRTREAVNSLLEEALSHPEDAEFTHLLHCVHSKNIPHHMYRGHTILMPENSKRTVAVWSEQRPSIWFVYSGLGSQWPGMGVDLLRIPVFAEAIRKCDVVLKPLGVNIYDIITQNTPGVFDTPINYFVGVVALQLGLTDVLTAVGVIPDGILGHSVGELVCAYAAGCFTREQTILCAYYIGLACIESSIPRGALLLTKYGSENDWILQTNELQLVEKDTHEHVCLLAGQTVDIIKCARKLRRTGMEARILNCGGVPCHSELLAPVQPVLLEYLRKVIPETNMPTRKWEISSLLPDKKLLVAEFYTNNFLKPIKFRNSWKQVPFSATTLEISPNTLLGITKLSLYNSEQGVLHLLSTIGKLHDTGVAVDLTKLYPPVEYPVSRGTPMISPHIKWHHKNNWLVADESFLVKENMNSLERRIRVNVSDVHDAFYIGHNIDGRNLFPATGYLYLVWDTLAKKNGTSENYFNVHFKQVGFHRATHIPKSGVVTFTVTLLHSNGSFEVTEGGTSVATGFVSSGCSPSLGEFMKFSPPTDDAKDSIELRTRDIYKELRLRGYNYTGVFRSLTRVNPECTYGEIFWSGNWVAFIDNVLQMKILGSDTRNLFVPTGLDELSIDVFDHLEPTEKREETHIPVYVNKHLDILKCGGVKLRGIRASPISRRKAVTVPVLERHLYVPYSAENSAYTLQQLVAICVHIWLENSSALKVNVAELLEEAYDPISPILLSVFGNLPLIQANVTIFKESDNYNLLEIDSAINVQTGKIDGMYNVIKARNLFVNGENILPTLKSLSEGGCILSLESQNAVIHKTYSDISIIADYKFDDGRILMLKPRENNLDSKYEVIHVTQENYQWLLELQEALQKVPRRLLLVAQQEPLCGILGLFNCLYKEPGGSIARCFFILDEDAPPFDVSLPFYHEQLKKDLAVNILKGGEWGSYRHLLLENLPLVESMHSSCHLAVVGDLSTFTWYEGKNNSLLTSSNGGNDFIHVYYSGLNFKDIMLATGRLTPDVFIKERTKQDFFLGIEISGRTSSGERVMGFLQREGLSSVVYEESSSMWKVPDGWSLEDAATVPVVYSTVLSAFLVHGRIKKGESILIHSGTGGVGQAAIHVALHYGLTIFTTVGTNEKREFIRREFPQIPSQNIGNSRDTSFEQMVMRETGGRGVDLVLNSLAEEKLVASVRCLAHGGRFLEIGKFDLAKNNHLSMELFLKNISYHGVMLDLLASWRDKMQELSNIMASALAAGIVKPLKSRTIFSENEVEEAFRFMASGKHMGKVLIKLRDEEQDRLAIPSPKLMKARPRFYCNENLSYIIAGGLGGFGLELADWLVLRGARNLVLVSRKGVCKGYQSHRIRIWKSYGVNIFVSKQDLATYEGAKELIKEAEGFAPVGGVFNLAVVLRDALVENQTEDNFLESAKGKALATEHLDALTREMCPKLHQFVVFSSVSCGRGNPGQTNYGMSNSVMERICEARARDGLPGLAVQWGAIGEVGLVADMQEDNRELVIGGTLQQSLSSCLKVMDDFLLQPHPVVASMVVAEKRANTSSENPTERILAILGLQDTKKFRQNTPLSELGMDSMTGAEIKQILEQEFEVFLTAAEIRDLTVEQLDNLSMRNQAETTTKSNEGLDIGDGFLLTTSTRTLLSRECSDFPLVVPLPCLNTSPDTVFLIPGIEGLVDNLYPLAAQLNNHVLSLQFFSQDCGSTVSMMANFLMQLLVSRVDSTIPVHLVGFSFGGLLALEIAALLETEGRSCKLVLIDSSPDLLLRSVQKLTGTGEEGFQILYIMYLLEMEQVVNAAVRNKMLQQLQDKSWEERLEWFVKNLSTELPDSATRLASLINGVMERLKAVTNYKWEHSTRIISPVLLLKPTKTLLNIEDDYGLSKFCENVVAVHSIEGNHVKILEHPDTAKYINEFLANSK